MILPDWYIKTILKDKIAPFEEEQVNPASYDVRLDNSFINMDGEEITADEFILQPGDVVLATTLESFIIPKDICASLHLKSTVGRSWIDHSLSGWIDPGFRGQITLELKNIGKQPRILRRHDRIAQIVFSRVLGGADVPYGQADSHYQNQVKAKKAWKEYGVIS